MMAPTVLLFNSHLDSQGVSAARLGIFLFVGLVFTHYYILKEYSELSICTTKIFFFFKYIFI